MLNISRESFLKRQLYQENVPENSNKNIPKFPTYCIKYLPKLFLKFYKRFLYFPTNVPKMMVNFSPFFLKFPKLSQKICLKFPKDFLKFQPKTVFFSEKNFDISDKIFKKKFQIYPNFFRPVHLIRITNVTKITENSFRISGVR